MTLKTLSAATARYRLNNPTMSNAEIAERLEIINHDGDCVGTPACCFFSILGTLVAIRTKPDELAIFLVYEKTKMIAQSFSERVLAQDFEATM